MTLPEQFIRLELYDTNWRHPMYGLMLTEINGKFKYITKLMTHTQLITNVRIIHSS